MSNINRNYINNRYNRNNNTTYKSAVTREMQKINAQSGCRCDFNGPVGDRDTAKLLKEVLIDNGVCDYVTENGILTDNYIPARTSRHTRCNCNRNICEQAEEEQIMLLQAIEREREAYMQELTERIETIDDTIEIIENPGNPGNIDNIDNIEGIRENHRCCNPFCRKHRRCNRNNRNNDIERRQAIDNRIEEINNRNRNNEEFNTNTNVYRFANQNFLDNLTGKSNIEISNISHNPYMRRLQIAEILQKYGKI